MDIETYCKRVECWNIISKKPYTLSEESFWALISPSERAVEQVRAKKDQKFDSGIQDEIGIFNKGAEYWKSMIERGAAQEVLTYGDTKALENAVNYCNFVYTELTVKQVKEILSVVSRLADNGIQ